MQAIARSVERHQGQGYQQRQETQATANAGTPERVGNPGQEPTAQERQQKTTEMLPLFSFAYFDDDRMPPFGKILFSKQRNRIVSAKENNKFVLYCQLSCLPSYLPSTVLPVRDSVFLYICLLSSLLVTWRVESSSPCRRVEDSSVWGSSVWPARTVVRQLVSGTGPCTRVHQYCSDSKLDTTEKQCMTSY
jgi:hypothetical protein